MQRLHPDKSRKKSFTVNRVMQKLFRKQHLEEKVKHCDHQSSDPVDDLSSLRRIKDNLRGVINIPMNLQCSITCDLPNDPVVSVYGDVFQKSDITLWLSRNSTCPNTRQPLTIDDLHVNASISELTANIKVALSDLIEAIDNMTVSDVHELEAHVKLFNVYSDVVNDFASDILKKIKNKVMFQDLISRLMLDICNPGHLKYWQNRANSGREICETVCETGTEKKFRIPKDVYDLMMICRFEYQSLDQLVDALNERIKRGQTLNESILKQFSLFITGLSRNCDAAASVIYAADDIRRLDLRKADISEHNNNSHII